MEVSFKARCIAQTKNFYKNKTTKIDLYELSEFDLPFINNLAKKIDYTVQMPDLCEFSQKRWQQVFNWAIEGFKENKNIRTILAVSDNKPCGILTFFEKLNGANLFLDCICDIPVDIGKRVNYTGSTLFCQLFKCAQNLKSKHIDLEAVIDGPFDVVSKYKEKGFKEIGTEGEYIKMRCNKYKIKEQLDELLSKISYKSVKNAEEINLEKLII